MSAFTKTISKPSGCLPFVFFLFTLPFLGIGSYHTYKEIVLRVNGEITVAKVVELESHVSSDSDSYHVSYEFKTASGVTVRDKSQVSYDNWKSLEKGMNVSVLYSPLNPNISRMASDNYLIFALIFLVVGSVLSVTTFVFMIKCIKHEKAKEYLKRNGLNINAKVVRIEQAGSDNKESCSALVYSFINPMDNTEIMGKSRWIHAGALEYLSEGDEIELLYNPDNPKQNFWADEDEIYEKSLSIELNEGHLPRSGSS